MRAATLARAILSLFLGAFTAEGGSVMLIPAPRMVRELGGVFQYQSSRVRLALRDSTGVAGALEELRRTSLAILGEPAPAHPTGSPVVWAGAVGVDPAFDRQCRAQKILPTDSLGKEGYTLHIGPKEVLIAARSAAGVFYGLETFIQLLRGSDRGKVPCLRIVDWPALRVRAVMDDISRGPVPRKEYFREQIRRCAEMKINMISYYTEHMVLTRSHPEFAPAGAALTIEQWKDLARYAKRYHVDLVGNFQSFGHFEKILSQPAYTHLGEGGSLLSPALEESYVFLRDIYREMVPAFTAPFFQTNCDEPFDLGKGASRNMVDSLGVGRVYVGHILRVREMLRALGTRMMIWGDVLLDHPEVIDLVPRDVVIGTWTYDTLADYHRYILPFRSRGFEVLVAPGVLNSEKTVPDFRQATVNIARFVRDGLSDGVSGAMTTVWDDGGSALFARDWYGVAFAADRMWNCDTTDTTFSNRFDVALYGDHLHGASRGIDCLLTLGELTPTYGMNERAIWSPVVPEVGRTIRLNVRGWDRVDSIAREAESLFTFGRPLVHGGDLEALRFTAELYEAAARMRLSMREAARLYRLAREASSREACRQDLVSVIGCVATVREHFQSLKDRYSALWLAENRAYALDSIQRRYDNRIEGLSDIERLVRAAIADVEKGSPLPPPEAVRLSIVETDGWYLLDWLIAGPIRGDHLDEDYLEGAGGEGGASPAVTQEFVYGDTTYRWKRLAADGPAEVDLSAIFPGAAVATVYAFATIESPSVKTVRALLGAGGNVCVFVNGEAVFDCAGALTVDQHTISLPLVKGKNRLLLKIVGGKEGPWGFSLRLPESDVRNRKNRYKLLE